MIQCPGITIIQCPVNNNVIRNSDSLSRNPLEPIPSTSWYNSNLAIPSASSPRNSVSAHSQSVPRINNNENTNTNNVTDNAKCSSPPSKKRRSRKRRVERRARERENRVSSFIHDARWANQRTAVPDSPVVPARVTQSLPEAVDPISPMRTAVYPPLPPLSIPLNLANHHFQSASPRSSSNS